MMPRKKILVVDDEAAIRFGIREFLLSKGYDVDDADSCRAAEEAFRTDRPDAAIIDYQLPDGNALDLLTRLRDIDPTVPLLVLTAHGSIDLAVQAIKEGAEQFLTKPLELPALLVILQRLLENQRNRQQRLAGKAREARESIDPFAGSSGAIRALAEQARRMLSTASPILIQGETGTGKGVLARWLYQHGQRADEAFVDLNCAGLSREFLETELFGHEKGAFTGAVASKPGLLEIAQRGTVFLDEIGDMPAEVQPKLLKVLEEKRFRRLGAVRDQVVDIALIAATHQDLSQRIKDGSFRSDLYFRVSTFPLKLPPLRERIEDIAILADHMLKKLANDLPRREVRLDPDAQRALQEHPWPGNVRELRNVLERAVMYSDKGVLKRADLRFDNSAMVSTAVSESNLTLEEIERAHIERVLREEVGRVAQAAARLGIARSSLYQKIQKHRIDLSKV